MGYIRKHKEGIRSGFEVVLLMGGVLGISPLIIYAASNTF